ARVKGRTVTVELRQPMSDRRARPMGTAGAMIYATVGPPEAPPEAPPASREATQNPSNHPDALTPVERWTTCRFVTKATAELTFGAEAGSVVHVTARWVNRRGEAGPVADAAS